MKHKDYVLILKTFVGQGVKKLKNAVTPVFINEVDVENDVDKRAHRKVFLEEREDEII